MTLYISILFYKILNYWIGRIRQVCLHLYMNFQEHYA